MKLVSFRNTGTIFRLRLYRVVAFQKLYKKKRSVFGSQTD